MINTDEEIQSHLPTILYSVCEGDRAGWEERQRRLGRRRRNPEGAGTAFLGENTACASLTLWTTRLTVPTIMGLDSPWTCPVGPEGLCGPSL